MAKVNGLGVRLYAAGYDLSGDVNVVDSIGYTQQLLDVTTLDKEATARIPGLSDSSLTVSGWFEAASDHAAYTSNSGKLPTADQIVFTQMGTDLGDTFAGLTAKEASYVVAHAPGSALATTASYSSTAGEQAEWGVTLTASKTTNASASSGTGVDNLASSANGCVAYLEAMSLVSGTCVVKVQHSTDNVTFTDLITFTSVTTATVPFAQRSTASGTINRYTRINTSGTFSSIVFVAGIARL